MIETFILNRNQNTRSTYMNAVRVYRQRMYTVVLLIGLRLPTNPGLQLADRLLAYYLRNNASAVWNGQVGGPLPAISAQVF